MNDENNRLSQFKKLYDNKNIVSSNIINDFDSFWTYRPSKQLLHYSSKEIQDTITSGSIDEKRELSRAFFETDGLYRATIVYYATLLYYYYLALPLTEKPKDINKKSNVTKFNTVLNFLNNSDIENLCTHWAISVLADGVYYGLIANINNNKMTIIDLPAKYCRTNYVGLNGNNIIEFNMAYFDKYKADKDLFEVILKSYPKYIQKAYRAYTKKTSN
jgi:hypothetical protein